MRKLNPLGSWRSALKYEVPCFLLFVCINPYVCLIECAVWLSVCLCWTVSIVTTRIHSPCHLPRAEPDGVPEPGQVSWLALDSQRCVAGSGFDSEVAVASWQSNTQVGGRHLDPHLSITNDIVPPCPQRSRAGPG